MYLLNFIGILLAHVPLFLILLICDKIFIVLWNY